MEDILPRLESESVDVIFTDPPYLYLKKQKLDKEFDEELFFNESKRVLKKNGFIVLFGRGTSFYRWNTMLAGLGFTFKEEVIWDKSYCTSPLMPMSRVHETVSIHCKGKAGINKVKVPYLEMKNGDIPGIIRDIKRLCTTFKNPKSLKAVESYLENNKRDISGSRSANHLSISSRITEENRCVSVMRSLHNGMNEKSIIRTDRYDAETFTRYGVNADKRKKGNRCVDVMQQIDIGMNEKSIIKETRDHYSAIHPTQKPVRLLERLLALVLPKNIERPVILDAFAGSFSTGEAAINMGCFPILIERDKEFFESGKNRLDAYIENISEEKRQLAINF